MTTGTAASCARRSLQQCQAVGAAKLIIHQDHIGRGAAQAFQGGRRAHRPVHREAGFAGGERVMDQEEEVGVVVHDKHPESVTGSL